MHRAVVALFSLAPIAVGACAGAPTARPASSAPLLFVTNEVSNDLSIVDTGRDEVVGTIAVGKRPWGIGLSPDGKRLFAANGPSDDVSVVDLDAEKEVARIRAGEGPWGIAVVTVVR